MDPVVYSEIRKIDRRPVAIPAVAGSLADLIKKGATTTGIFKDAEVPLYASIVDFAGANSTAPVIDYGEGPIDGLGIYQMRLKATTAKDRTLNVLITYNDANGVTFYNTGEDYTLEITRGEADGTGAAASVIKAAILASGDWPAISALVEFGTASQTDATIAYSRDKIIGINNTLLTISGAGVLFSLSPLAYSTSFDVWRILGAVEIDGTVYETGDGSSMVPPLMRANYWQMFRSLDMRFSDSLTIYGSQRSMALQFGKDDVNAGVIDPYGGRVSYCLL